MAVGSGAVVVEECPHRGEHGQIQADIEALRRDANRHEDEIGKLFDLARANSAAIGSAAAGIARIEGSIEGALKAKKVTGALLGVVLTISASAIVTLVIALIRASGKGG